MSVDPGLTRLASSLAITGFVGTTPPDWLLRRLDDGLGGVCWFGQNVENPQQVRALADALHGVRDDVLVMSDEEGGDVTRLEREAGSSWPGAAALGALDDVSATRAVAGELGRQVRGAGIDVCLAPVVDVNADPDNPVIGVRSFGPTPELVSRHGVSFVEGLQSQGVAACAKHFPGHGSTTVDSHLDLPRVDDAREVLRARDLAPFAAVVEAGVRCVMTAHVVFPAYDDQPATLSAVLLGLLRDELGFDGVIITDALDMAAIAEGVGAGEGAVRSLLAGSDLLCLGNPAYPERYDAQEWLDGIVGAVVEAASSGRLPVARLEEAGARVADLVAWRRSAPTRDARGVDPRVGEEVAARAVSSTGTVAVTAPVVVDLGGAVNIAAGLRDRHLAAAIVGRDPAATVAGEPVSGRDLVLVVRNPREPAVRGRLEALLAARPDAVVVQTGLPEDLTAERVVCTHGGGRAAAEAAATLLVPSS